MGSEPILTETHWFWPLVLFPFDIEKSHTRALTGKGSVADVKAGMSLARLDLSAEGLTVRGRLSGVAHLRIASAGLTASRLTGDSSQFVEVRFTGARWSRFARFLVSGAPAGARDRVLLSVAAPAEWKASIDRVIGAG